MNYLYIGVGVYNANLKSENYNLNRYKDVIKKIQQGWNIWACDPRYYKDEELEAIENSNWIDHFLNLDVCDEWSNVPLFDAWDCTSVLEHVKKEKANDFMIGLKSKISHNSIGCFSIDLSNHGRQFSDCLKYYEKKDKHYRVYLNGITKREWLNIIEKHFHFSKEFESIDRLILHDVKVKG